MNPATERLTVVATQIAAEGARRYLAAHNLRTDTGTLARFLAFWVKQQLPAALADAKKALDCGMDKAAESTFAASMILAGIEAAKVAQSGQTMIDIAITRIQKENLASISDRERLHQAVVALELDPYIVVGISA